MRFGHVGVLGGEDDYAIPELLAASLLGAGVLPQPYSDVVSLPYVDRFSGWRL